jgi:CheY-like chemotaxis protein
MASILIIDDDPTAAQVLAALLRREGHEAAVALGAGAALSHLRQEPEPDLVLLDLTMPTTDGIELLDALADEPRFADLRVAVHSGRTDEESKQQAQRLGACDFIPKGLKWSQLYGRIQSALRAEPVA